MKRPLSVYPVLTKIQRLSAFRRTLFWSGYRHAIQIAKREFPDVETAVVKLKEHIANRKIQEMDVGLIVQLAKIRFARTLNFRASPSRSIRKLATEYWVCIKREWDIASGRKAKPLPDSFDIINHHSAPEPLLIVVTDASIRGEQRGIGVVAYVEKQEVLVRLSLNTPERDIVGAELHAALTGLRTVQALGYSAVCLRVDAQAVVRAFEGRLSSRYAALQSELQETAQCFARLLVQKVPRTMTWQADALASIRTSPQAHSFLRSA